MAARNRRLEQWAPWVLAVAILVLWQIVCTAFNISDFIFPSPIQIARSLVEHWRAIAGHAWQTLWTTMAGFAIGVAVGLLLVVFNSIPKAAFVPILVVWFGIGTVPAVLTAFLICFFPIVVNVATGLATLEPELEDVLRSLGATKADILWKVGLPRSLPYFF